MSNDGLSTDEKVNLLFKNFMNFTSTLDEKPFYEETALANNTNIFSDSILTTLPSTSPSYDISISDVTVISSLLETGISDISINSTWYNDKIKDSADNNVGSFQKDASNVILRMERIKLDYVNNSGAAFVCYDNNGTNILQNIIPSNYAPSGYSISLEYEKSNGVLKPIAWLATRQELAGNAFVGSSVNFGGALFDAKNGIITFYDVNGSPSDVFSDAKFYFTATKYVGPKGAAASGGGGNVNLDASTGIIIDNNEISIDTDLQLFTDIDTSVNALESTTATHTTEIGVLDSSVNVLESTTTTLTTEIGVLDSSVNALESTTATHTTEIGVLDSSVNALESTTATHTTEIGVLDSSVNALESTTATHTTEIDVLDSSVNALESTTATHTTEIGVLDSSVNALESTTTTLTTEIGVLDSSVNALESTTATHTVQISDISSNVRDLSSNFVSRARNAISAGTGVSITDGTISIGQSVGTTNDVTFKDLTLSGNLTVNGTTTTLDTQNLDVSDSLIGLSHGLTGTPVNDAGILINRGDSSNVFMGWDESEDKFTMGTTLATSSSTGNLTITPGTLVADLSGNAETVTNGVYTTGDQTIGGDKTFSDATTMNSTLDVVGDVSFGSTLQVHSNSFEIGGGFGGSLSDTSINFPRGSFGFSASSGDHHVFLKTSKELQFFTNNDSSPAMKIDTSKNVLIYGRLESEVKNTYYNDTSGLEFAAAFYNDVNLSNYGISFEDPLYYEKVPMLLLQNHRGAGTGTANDSGRGVFLQLGHGIITDGTPNSHHNGVRIESISRKNASGKIGMEFRTFNEGMNSVPAMRISHNNRVGIGTGTTDPGYTLDVSGTCNVSGTSTVTYDNSGDFAWIQTIKSPISLAKIGTTYSAYNDKVPVLSISADRGGGEVNDDVGKGVIMELAHGTRGVRLETCSKANYSSKVNLEIRTCDGDISYSTVAMVVSHDDRVGIGIRDPDYTLDVSGDTRLKGSLNLGSTANEFTVDTSGNTYIDGTLDVSGVATAPTANPGTNSTQIATTAFVSTAVSNYSTTISEKLGKVDISINMLDSSVNSLETTTATHTTEISILDSSVNSLETTTATHTTEISILDSSVNSLETTTATHTTEISILDSSVNSLETTTATHTTEISILDSSVNSLETTTATHTTEISILDSSVNSLETTTATHTTEISILDSSVNALESTTATHTSQISVLDTTISDISSNFISRARVAISAGTGVSISDGAISIGQNVGTTNDVTFNNLNLSGTLDVTGNLTLSGDLTVNGSTTTLNTQNLDISDNIIGLNRGFTGNPVNDAGILINRGDASNVFMGWDESEYKFTMGTTNATSSSTGNLTITPGTLVANLSGNADTVTNGVYTTGNQNVDGNKFFDNLIIPGSNNKVIRLHGTSFDYSIGMKDMGNSSSVYQGKGFGRWTTRFIMQQNYNQGFLFTNDESDCLLSIRASDGLTYINGNTGIGFDPSVSPYTNYKLSVNGTAYATDISAESSIKVGSTSITDDISSNSLAIGNGYNKFTVDTAGNTEIAGTLNVDNVVSVNPRLIIDSSNISNNSNDIGSLILENTYVDNSINYLPDPTSNDYTHFDKSIALTRSNNYRYYFIGMVGDNSSNDNRFAIGGNSGGSAWPNIGFALNANGNATIGTSLAINRDINENYELDVSGNTRLKGSLGLGSNATEFTVDATGNTYIDGTLDVTGVATAPTASIGTNTTQIATTAFVSTAVSNLVDSAPGTLDTLNELAAALGDDANYSTTISEKLGKVDISINIIDSSVNALESTTATHTSNISILDSSVNVLESTTATHTTEISILDSSVNALESTTATHTSQISVLDSSVNALESTTATHTTEISILDSSVNVLESTTATHTTEISILDSSVNALESTTATHTSQISVLDTTISDISSNFISRARDAISAGTGVSISDGAISIGQNVGTTNDVTFNNLNLSGTLDVTGNLTLSGDLTVNGSTTTLNTQNLDISDNIIGLNRGLTGTPNTNTGILMNRGSSSNVFMGWDELRNKFTMGTTSASSSTSGYFFTITPGTLIADLSGNAETVTNGVYTTGDQTITGDKTFSDLVIKNGNYIRLLTTSASDETYSIGVKIMGDNGGKGFSGYTTRFSMQDTVNQGFLFTNLNNDCLLSIRASDGLTYIHGNTGIGFDPTNSDYTNYKLSVDGTAYASDISAESSIKVGNTSITNGILSNSIAIGNGYNEFTVDAAGNTEIDGTLQVHSNSLEIGGGFNGSLINTSINFPRGSIGLSTAGDDHVFLKTSKELQFFTNDDSSPAMKIDTSKNVLIYGRLESEVKNTYYTDTSGLEFAAAFYNDVNLSNVGISFEDPLFYEKVPILLLQNHRGAGSTSNGINPSYDVGRGVFLQLGHGIITDGTPNSHHHGVRIESISQKSGSKQIGMEFRTFNEGMNSVPAMRINHNNRVGIGTTAPGYTLDVSGTCNVSGTSTVTYDNSGDFAWIQTIKSPISLAKIGTTYSGYNDKVPVLSIRADRGGGEVTDDVGKGVILELAHGTRGVRLETCSKNNFSSKVNLEIRTYNNDISYSTVAMVVSHNDRVGIGTRDPISTLDVSGDTRLAGSLNLGSTTNEFTVDSSGNTYIDGTLDVSGVATAPTANPGTNSTQIATTAFVSTAVSNIQLETISAGTNGDKFTVDAEGNTEIEGTLNVSDVAIFDSNVGIGIPSDPSYNLDVSGTFRVNVGGNDLIKTVILGDASNTTHSIQMGNSLQDFSGVVYKGLSVTNSNNNDTYKIQINEYDRITLNVGRTYSADISVSFLWQSHLEGGHSGGSGTRNQSINIFSDEAIVSAAGVYVYSDKRIKKDILTIDDDKALNDFRKLNPCTYSYIDTIGRGTDSVYGFIAQEVNEVLPNACTTKTETIPNVYSIADISDNFLILTNGTFDNLEYDLTNASGNVYTQICIAIEGVDRKKTMYYIKNIVNSTTIELYEEIPSSLSLYNEITGKNQCFVFGQFVNNFNALDKNVIWTVAAAATQEIDRQQQRDKVRIAELEMKVETLENQLVSVLQRLTTLENA